jgi:hypothetical protein
VEAATGSQKIEVASVLVSCSPRAGQLSGLKVGQLWLIDKQTLDSSLENAQQLTDQRFGPKWFIRELL